MAIRERVIRDIGISDEDVTRILDRLDAAEIRVKDSERRSVRRYMRGTAIVAAVLRPGASPELYRVRMRNISEHGVAVLSPVAFEPGTRIFIELPVGPALSIVKKPAVVRRCRSVEGTIHEIGAEFGT